MYTTGYLRCLHLNQNGESPLHLAVITQPMDVIETLVDMGMNPNIQNKVSSKSLRTH